MNVSGLDDPQIPPLTYSGAAVSLPLEEGNLTRDLIPHSHTGSHHGAVTGVSPQSYTGTQPVTHHFTPTLHLPTIKERTDLLQQIGQQKRLKRNPHFSPCNKSP